MVNYSTEYIIIIDDDQLFPVNWVTRMWKIKKPKTFTCWYGKIWRKNSKRKNYWKDTLLYLPHCLKNEMKMVKSYQYGGPGGCVIDTDIFDPISRLWNFPDNIPDGINIYNLDDIWISYIVSCLGWKITRSFLPIRPMTGDEIDKVSISLEVKKEKEIFFAYLIKGMNWAI